MNQKPSLIHLTNLTRPGETILIFIQLKAQTILYEKTYGNDDFYYHKGSSILETEENNLILVGSKFTAGVDSVDTYKVDMTEFTATEAANAISYSWSISPEEAGVITGDGLVGTVTWNVEFIGDAMITVQSINDCDISDYSEAKTVTIYNSVGFEDLSHLVGIKVIPNPNSGEQQ